MIRFIIDTVSSKTDVNGNRYHFCTVTSTKTGKSIQVRCGNNSDAYHQIRKKLGVEWYQLHCTQSDVMIRDYQRLVRAIDLYDHNLTVKELKALERKVLDGFNT